MAAAAPAELLKAVDPEWGQPPSLIEKDHHSPVVFLSHWAPAGGDTAASSGKRKARGYWWDPKATPATLLERFGSSFDIALCPGVKAVDGPELKAAAYIQAGLGLGFYDNEECAGDMVVCHATSVPANSCPPSWAR